MGDTDPKDVAATRGTGRPDDAGRARPGDRGAAAEATTEYAGNGDPDAAARSGDPDNGSDVDPSGS